MTILELVDTAIRALRQLFYFWIVEVVGFFLETPRLFFYQKIPPIFTLERSDNPLVSIIVPVHNKYPYTIQCLYSILLHTRNIPVEVIVADDASSDQTHQISLHVQNISVLKNRIPLGFLKNCNAASAHAKGKYLVFLNNDTCVQKDWLRHLLDLVETEDSVGVVGPKFIYSNGVLQEAGGILWKDASGMNYGRGNSPFRHQFNYVKEADYISGACFLIKKKLWDEIGGFDERYAPAYYEDADLAFEVRKRKYKVLYQPKAMVVHFEGVSHGKNIKQKIKRYQAINKEKFFKKWEGVLEREAADPVDLFVARDRSKDKKTILVVDWAAPHPDTQAGFRSTFQYLRFFLDMKMNVKFLGDSFFGASKLEPYVTGLRQMGVEVLPWGFYNDSMGWKKWIKTNGRYLDFVYLNRPDVSIKYVDFLKKHTKAKLVYCGHDLHYLRFHRESLVNENRRLGEKTRRYQTLEFKIFEEVDQVVYFSQFEVNEIKKAKPRIDVRVIPLFIYPSKPLVQYDNSRKGLLFVGGFKHLPNVDAMIWFVKEIFPSVISQIPTAKLSIVGSNPPPLIAGLSNENVEVTGWVSDEDLTKYYQRSRLMVAPLRYGAGVKGKIIEAVYNQVPVITTAIGAEGLMDSQPILTVAADAEDFSRKIVALYGDIGRLRTISHKSHGYIEQHFSKAAVIKALKGVIF